MFYAVLLNKYIAFPAAFMNIFGTINEHFHFLAGYFYAHMTGLKRPLNEMRYFGVLDTIFSPKISVSYCR